MIEIDLEEVEKLVKGKELNRNGETIVINHLNRGLEDYDYRYKDRYGEALEIPKDISELDINISGQKEKVDIPNNLFVGGMRLYLELRGMSRTGRAEPLADYAIFDAKGNYIDSDLFYDWAEGVEFELSRERTETIYVCANWLNELNDRDAEITINEIEPIISEGDDNE